MGEGVGRIGLRGILLIDRESECFNIELNISVTEVSNIFSSRIFNVIYILNLTKKKSIFR